MKNLLELLDRPIAFQRPLVTITGSITGALLLSQAIYWQRRCTSEDGWWWKTQADWQEETGMTRTELETARSKCSKFLDHKKAGLPAKSFYRINIDALQASLQESCNQGCSKPANRVAGKLQSTNGETTSETSTEKIEAAGAAPSPNGKFHKPSVEEIALQCAKIGLPANEGEAFFDYYESNGWRVGKNPMRKWTSALANWKRNWQAYGSKKFGANPRQPENPRNVGLCESPEPFINQVNRKLARQEQERLAREAARAANHAPETFES